MENALRKVLHFIGERYKDKISPDSQNYLEVDIGNQAGELGYEDIKNKYPGVSVVVPVKTHESGAKVMIDGRTFLNYVQMASGIVVPEYIAKDAEMAYTPYIAKESMILNFA